MLPKFPHVCGSWQINLEAHKPVRGLKSQVLGSPRAVMTPGRSLRSVKWGVGLAFGVSMGTVSATIDRSQVRLPGDTDRVDVGHNPRKTSLWWVPSLLPIIGMTNFKQCVCEGSIAQTPVIQSQRTRLSAAFQETSNPRPQPKDHPWIATAPAAPDTLLPEERIITFLVANAAAGKVKEVKRDWSFLPPHMHAAGMEALLQNHLLVGFPRTINAIAAVHQVGVEGSEWKEEPKADPAFWRSRGEEALGAVYGAKYERLRNRMESLHPVLNSIMAEHAYGRVISREGALTLRMRELCVVAVLTGQDVAPQLQSHLYGARNVGATPEEISAVVAQTELPWGAEARTQACNTLQDFLQDIRSQDDEADPGPRDALPRRSKM